MKGSFKFVLRGTSDLAYKWIKEKRNIPSQNIKGGVSIYALGEYFFNVFFLDKLLGFENANVITRLIKDNNKNKDWIAFGEKLIIPFFHKEYLIKKGSVKGFYDIALNLGVQNLYQEKKLSDILTRNEIQTFAINSYHIFYDVTEAKENLSYDDILAHPKLFFKNNNELIFLSPKAVEVPVREVVKSSEESVLNLQMGTQKVEVNKIVIVLDPGHGGIDNSGGDPGCVVGDIYESVIVLSIAKKLKTILEKNNYKVILTRDGEYLPVPLDYKGEDKIGRSLSHRAEFANSNKANMFISLHLNAADNKNAKGMEVFYYDSKNGKSKKLAEKILASTSLFNRDRGVKVYDYKVIKTWENLTDNPGCLVEIGFLTNLDDFAKLRSDVKQITIANDLYGGIKKYYED